MGGTALIAAVNCVGGRGGGSVGMNVCVCVCVWVSLCGWVLQSMTLGVCGGMGVCVDVWVWV